MNAKIARYIKEIVLCLWIGVRLSDQLRLIRDTLRFHAWNAGWLDGKPREQTKAYRIQPCDTALEVQLRPFAGDFFVFHEVFLDEPYWIPESRARAVSTVVDLGANIGMTTLYLSCLVPEAQYFCVEPNPHNVLILKKNVSFLGERVSVVEGAISDHSGSLEFEAQGPSWGTKDVDEAQEYAQSVEVRAHSMSSLLRECGIDTIDVLKIDIEGAERRLFKTSNEWLQQVEMILIEVHKEYSRADFREEVEACGFEVYDSGSSVGNNILMAVRT